MTAQAIVAQTQSSTSNVVATGVAASQGAPGQTAAIQATNQLIAALSTQLSQLQTLMLTAARSAETAEAQHQSVTAAAASESVRALQFSAPPSRLEDPSKL
jgi:P-type conjugative transfer protein TrbJ